MRIKLKRIFSAVLSLALVGCMIPTTAVTISADEPVQEITAKANVQDGVILHCFDWSFNTIKANMAAIAEAGYTAVQTSPIQQCKQATRTNGINDSNEDWWLFYQPVTFTIDNTGTSALGTKEEFTQMCEEAHNYGIHVIVDVVANHLGNDGDYTKSSAIADNIRNNSAYWHPNWNKPANHDIREQSINYSLGGLPDLNTENADIQRMVLDYLKECIDAGADGFRFDAAKHIGVDADGEQYTFWKNTIPAAKTYYQTKDTFENLYCYGEILNGITQTTSYMQYLDALTDTVGNGIRNNVASHNASGASGSSYWNTYLNTNQKVLWAESHDTYSNDTKESTYISDSDINKTWALVASRAGATALYFARTDGYRGGTMGDACSDEWKSAEVSAVNQFHNAFDGQSEYLAYSGNIAYNERGKKGVVLVNVNGTSTNVGVTANKMMDGTYTDQITGNIFTVANGYISGNIGSTGIAVVYNPDDTEEPYIKNDTMYLKPNSTWKANNSRFAMYLWDGSGNNTWADMTDTDGDGTYSGDVPSGKWTGIIFCCMNGSTTENNWTNRIYKTVDLFPDENTDRYTLRSGVGTETESTKGTWDSFHTHSYGEPAWEWADDYSSVTATFTCSGCDNTVTATDSAPETDYISTVRTHTAAVTDPDGEEYPCTAYEPMVVQTPSHGSIMYQFTDTEKLVKLYQCVVNQTAFTGGSSIDVSSCNILFEDSDSAVYTLLNIFPELNFVDAASGFGMIASSNGQYLSKLIFSRYTMPKEEFDTESAAFYTKADEYLSLLNDDMDDFTKALVLHDRLVLDHYYQVETETEYSSNYTFMLDGWGRCENYAEVYAYLLARAGIKSEIVDGNAGGAHEWIRICLDGKWYNIDITFDDPTVNGSDRPNKVSHKFFLASDALIRNSAYHTTVHEDFVSIYPSDISYDGYDKLHGNENPFFYADDALWTLYAKQDVNNSNFKNGVLAIYSENDYIDFEYGDILPIKDRWSAGGSSIWRGNYSGLAEYDGKLYINGEHNVYEFDPETSTPAEFVTYSEHQLYGIYVKDNILYGLSADSPNDTPVPVILHAFDLNRYTVRWVNYDGSELEKDENVTEGTMPSYDGAEPTKPSDAQYDYTFSGWTPNVTVVTGNVTYEADYTPSLRNYTVVWQDYDNNVLETDINVPYGTTPTYDSETPSRESYTFKGWNPQVTTVTGNAVYTAEYDIIPTGILITEYNFANWDEVYIYYWGGDSTVAWPGKKMNSADSVNFKFTYTIPSDATNIIFNGNRTPQTANLALTDGTEWSVSLTNTTVNANPYPTYYLIGSMNNWTRNDTSYTFVPNMNENGFEEYVLTTELSANDAVKVFGGTNYYPSGGEASNYTVAADGTYRIYFRRNSDGYNDWHRNTLNVINITPCTVSFSDGVASQTVTYGNCAAQPAQPSKENYTFIGWYLDGEPYDFNTPVTADITLTAHWLKNAVDIQFIDVNGKVKTTLTITPIDNSFANVTVTGIPSVPYLDGYTFTGWTVGQNSYSDADALKTALESLVAEEPEDDIIVKEVYTQAETLYVVTAVNGTVRNSKNDTSGSYKASDQIYVTATGGSPEQDFSYWTKQDEGSEPVIVGYEETYAFRMPSKSTTLTAVYEGKKDKLGTAYIESVTKTGDSSISFVAILSVPDGATMLRAGIVACKASDLINGHTEPSIDYARFKRYNETTCRNYTTFKYTWTKGNINPTDTWCVRAYLLYSDENGEHTVYSSDMVSANLSDFQ